MDVEPLVAGWTQETQRRNRDVCFNHPHSWTQVGEVMKRADDNGWPIKLHQGGEAVRWCVRCERYETWTQLGWKRRARPMPQRRSGWRVRDGLPI